MKSLLTGSINGYKLGLLFNKGGVWVGLHWSPYNRRLCINVIPCLTLWISMPNGTSPSKDKA